VRLLVPLIVGVLVFLDTAHLPAQPEQRYLYVAVADPSLAILAFDIPHSHRFVKRIPLWSAAGGEGGESIRGVAAHARTGRLYVSTTKRLAAIDLKTEKIVWEKSYDGRGCDRIAVSPDGQTIHAPAFERPKWYVIDAANGELRASLAAMGWPRQALYSRDGRRAYLSAWESSTLSIADTTRHEITKSAGPFSAFVCPFTVNAKDTLAFANVDGLVGFEVADLQTGLILDSVASDGYDKDAASQYECPSHGIAFTPDQRELWVADGVRNRLHVYDATVYPPSALTVIELPAQPRWIAFSRDGRYAYSSTGDIVDAATKKIAGALADGDGRKVTSEQMIEIDIDRP